MMTRTQQIIAGLVKHAEKTAMHGYADYQMTEPITPPNPQMPLSFYGDEAPAAEAAAAPSYAPPAPASPSERGILSGGVPWRWATGGAMAGSFGGKALMEDTLRRESNMINFLKGKGGPKSPVVQDILMSGVEKGKILPEQLAEAREMLTDPARIKSEYFTSPGAWEQALKKSRKAYWQSMGKGPGIGLLGGAAAGLGAGLLYNNFFGKESSAAEDIAFVNKLNALTDSRSLWERMSTPEKVLAGASGGLASGAAGYGIASLLGKESQEREPGLLSKEAFRAPPPREERVESAWHDYTPSKSRAFAHGKTQLAASPYEKTHIFEAPQGRTMAARPQGLLSKATQVARRVHL